MRTAADSQRLGRRAFLRGGALFLAAAAGEALTLDHLHAAAADDPAAESPGLRLGLITDLHYADKAPHNTRHYRDTPAKLAEAAAAFRRAKPAFVVELGDLIDAAADVETEHRWLERINRDFAAIADERHCVLGNHCVDTLTKPEFLAGVKQERSYYSFDRGGFHFVVLDACFRADGEPYGRKNSHWTDANIPAAELDWLAADLKATDHRTIVFAHQRLDVANNHGVKNQVAVRAILESSGKVAAVFQGHSHQNDYRDIAGIHYCTLVAMVEGPGPANSGYSLLDLPAPPAPEGPLRLTGFRNQKSYEV